VHLLLLEVVGFFPEVPNPNTEKSRSTLLLSQKEHLAFSLSLDTLQSSSNFFLHPLHSNSYTGIDELTNANSRPDSVA
jgi:hypothetical protein